MLILTCSQVDNVDTSRRAYTEPIAEAVTPPVETGKDIPEVYHSLQPRLLDIPF